MHATFQVGISKRVDDDDDKKELPTVESSRVESGRMEMGTTSQEKKK